MGIKGWTAAFLGQCNVSRKHRPAMTQQRVMATKNTVNFGYKRFRYKGFSRIRDNAKDAK